MPVAPVLTVGVRLGALVVEDVVDGVVRRGVKRGVVEHLDALVGLGIASRLGSDALRPRFPSPVRIDHCLLIMHCAGLI